MKKIISTSAAPAAIGPYSQAVEAGGFVFTSGQLGLNPLDGQFAAGGVTEQTAQALENLKQVLAAAGCEMADVLKTTVFLADMNDFAAMNAVYERCFPAGACPARSAVQVAKLPKGGLVEIEAVAVAKH